MYLDEMLAKQKQGEASGIFSVCSAHPYVIQQTLQTCETFGVPPLIEATCNQVNQFGGYTGMRPADFVRYLRGIATQSGYPFEKIILGGDHLGPSVWQDEPAGLAMAKAESLIREYVEAGFVKIHLDCSMRLADDPVGALDIEVSAQRAAHLAAAAEGAVTGDVRYVIGTEVPVPGGATEHEEGVSVSRVEDVQQTIAVTRAAFDQQGLHAAWERVLAVVVQPGVEFGDDFVLAYQPQAAKELSRFIETQPMVYEAHSTDYQTPEALKNLVKDHFAVLKVGPALTFAYREGVFALASLENELFPPQERSNIVSVLEGVMLDQPKYWAKYYSGDENEVAFKRKYSLSDRIRYYWTEKRVQMALEKLLKNLSQRSFPLPLLERTLPGFYQPDGPDPVDTPERILLRKIQLVLNGYAQACQPD
ncbi:MAG TPA: class II D-tagatose-bisphosphate aldolase, non-catalytic subunit [Longilinea sp.]|nr:class II D-tagatose-bisphosphate aldolase, non-catalytic subunit [Longilinea sp.]